MSIDLVQLARWSHPQLRCERCGFLFRELRSATEWKHLEDLLVKSKQKAQRIAVEFDKVIFCSFCYNPKELIVFTVVKTHSTTSDYLEQGISLGKTVQYLPPYWSSNQKLLNKSYAPLALLFDLINSAKWFIHFTTWNVDTALVGALRLAANRGVYVWGVVGNTKSHDYVVQQIESLENNRLKVWIHGHNTNVTIPNHGKLIIVDGLVAIKGSANLSVNAWLNAAENPPKEIIEATAKPNEVTNINNEVFVPLWEEVLPSDWGSTI